MDTNNEQKTCETCKHWKKLPADPANLSRVAGECRQGPPHLTIIPHPRGGIAKIAGYPELEAAFPACDQHAAQLVTDGNER